MALPEQVIMWLLTALLASWLPPKHDPAPLDDFAEALVQRTFPPESAGEDAWPAMRAALRQVHDTSTSFYDSALDRFPDAFIALTDPVAESPDLPADQVPAAAAMQAEAIDALAHTGVFRDLAAAATSPRCRPPLVRMRRMNTQLMSSLRIATQVAQQRCRIAAERGDWPAVHESLLAIAGCARATEARGTMISGLLAASQDRVLTFAICQTIPRTRPTATEARGLREALLLARARRLSIDKVLAFEDLFWRESADAVRSFADRWPVDGVRRAGDIVAEIGELDLSAVTGGLPNRWPNATAAILGPLLARKTESRYAVSLGLRVLSRETVAGVDGSPSAVRSFEDYIKAMPPRLFIESRALRHAASFHSRAVVPMERRTMDSGIALVIALAEYHAKNGVFPAGLSDLAPEILTKLPEDPLAPDRAFRYYRGDDGATYNLYSVGQDGVDNAARPPKFPGEALKPIGKGTDFVFVPFPTPQP